MKTLSLSLLCLLPALVFGLNGANEIPFFSEKRRVLTSEFAILQRDLKASKTPAQSSLVFRRLDDFCLKVNALRGDESPPYNVRPFGILAECDDYRRYRSGTTERALSLKVNTVFNELKTLPLPTASNYTPQDINKIQRVLDKMNELLVASERVRIADR